MEESQSSTAKRIGKELRNMK